MCGSSFGKREEKGVLLSRNGICKCPVVKSVILGAFPGVQWHACQCRSHRRYGFDPCVGKIPWRRKWKPTPVFLPGKFHR